MAINNLFLNKVEAMPGTSIDTACSEAISLAVKLDMRVELDFNGITIRAQRNSTVSILVDRYYEGLKLKSRLELKEEVESQVGDVETLQAVVDVLEGKLQRAEDSEKKLFHELKPALELLKQARNVIKGNIIIPAWTGKVDDLLENSILKDMETGEPVVSKEG